MISILFYFLFTPCILPPQFNNNNDLNKDWYEIIIIELFCLMKVSILLLSFHSLKSEGSIFWKNGGAEKTWQIPFEFARTNTSFCDPFYGEERAGCQELLDVGHYLLQAEREASEEETNDVWFLLCAKEEMQIISEGKTNYSGESHCMRQASMRLAE